MGCNSCSRKVGAKMAPVRSKVAGDNMPKPPKYIRSDKSILFQREQDVVIMSGYIQDPDNPLRLINVIPEGCNAMSSLMFNGIGYEMKHVCRGCCEHKGRVIDENTCKDCECA